MSDSSKSSSKSNKSRRRKSSSKTKTKKHTTLFEKFKASFKHMYYSERGTSSTENRIFGFDKRGNPTPKPGLPFGNLCFFVELQEDGSLMIENIRDPPPQDCHLSGNEILENIIAIAKKHKIPEIYVTDTSKIMTPSGSFSLAAYSLLKYGKSWYERHGFSQIDPLPDADKYLQNLRETPLSDLETNPVLLPYAYKTDGISERIMRKLSELDRPFSSEMNIREILDRLDTKNERDLGVIAFIVNEIRNGFEMYTVYKGNLRLLRSAL